MVRLTIKPNGNCQFRAVATLLSGSDDNENHTIFLACEQFENKTGGILRRTGFFSHGKTDCITEDACKKTNKHSGGYLGLNFPFPILKP